MRYSNISNRIQIASKATVPSVRMNRTLIRDGKYDFADMEYLLGWEVRNLLNTPEYISKHVHREHTLRFEPG